jgi:LppX_LprAFG lipoprotein
MLVLSRRDALKLLAIAGVGLVACKPAKPPALTAADIIQNSSVALKAVKAVHFKLAATGGMMSIGTGLVAKSIEGDVVQPDRLKGTAVSTFGKVTVEISFVVIGANQFITNPITKQWQALPATNAAPNLLDPDKGAASLISQATNLTKLDNHTVGGTDCYHLTATIPASLVAGLVGAAGGTSLLASEIWIATSDSLPRQINLAGPVTSDEPPAIQRILELSNFNESITIDPPA